MGTSKESNDNQKNVESVYLQLDSTHLLERMRELVRVRLVECGWRDQVRLHCRKILTENQSNNEIMSVNDLIKAATPKARSLVPDSVKRELLHELEINVLDAAHLPKSEY